MESILPARVATALQDFADRVRLRFGARVLAMRLYGSYARGEARTWSDVDVFVRIDQLTEAERGALFETAGEVNIAHLVTIQVFAPLPQEHEWLVRNECRIMRDIAADGAPL